MNADDMVLIQILAMDVSGANIFRYCENNAINSIDLDGYITIKIGWIGFAIDMIIWIIPTLYVLSKTWKAVSSSANKLNAFGKQLIVVAHKLFKKIDDRLYCAFARSSSYRIAKTIGTLAIGIMQHFSSIGKVIQYIIDILDGKWDDKLNLSNIAPKICLKKE